MYKTIFHYISSGKSANMIKAKLLSVKRVSSSIYVCCINGVSMKYKMVNGVYMKR